MGEQIAEARWQIHRRGKVRWSSGLLSFCYLRAWLFISQACFVRMIYNAPGHTPATCPALIVRAGCTGGARELRFLRAHKAQFVIEKGIIALFW